MHQVSVVVPGCQDGMDIHAHTKQSAASNALPLAAVVCGTGPPPPCAWQDLCISRCLLMLTPYAVWYAVRAVQGPCGSGR